MRRFGAPAVTLGFLTVGVQTAINASAGMLRMPQRRFLPAVTLGALLWSLVYTTVGFTVVDAWLGDGRRGGGRLRRRSRVVAGIVLRRRAASSGLRSDAG